MPAIATELPRTGNAAAAERAWDTRRTGLTAALREQPRADRPVILTPDQRVRVFISSTLQELAEERAAARRAIRRLHLVPVWYESGARPHPPRRMYRAYLEQSQVFVGIYWQRYGWVAPGMDISGLEDEYRLAAGKPMLLYLKRPAPDTEPRMTAFLDGIRAAGTVSYRTFTTPRELERLLADDLAVLLSESFAGAAMTSATPDRSQTRPGESAGVRQTAGTLPVQVNSFVGRERELKQAAAMLGQARLVTLTGPGGIGKTRLAVSVAERLRDRFGAGLAFVPLAAVTDPGLVLGSVARAVGADLGGAGSPLQALAEWFGDERWLLILDNLEQVVSVAGDLGELLARCREVAILATSRTVLGLAAEQEYPVPPLPLPTDPAAVPWAELESSPAVALFVDRARAVRPGFALAEGNAAEVAEICCRLEGLPLAIELAAARIRLLDPAALLARLTVSLDALGTGAVDLPERQRTLRATVQWSVGLLDEAERSLLETAAVFAGGWTIGAAAQVAGLEEDRTLELSESLARHSLIQLDPRSDGSRCQMLETVRGFVAEQLAARPDAAEIQRRHADYYRALTEQADLPLRGGGHAEWLERLQAEAGNLAAAGRWALGHDPAGLPHLFRILYPFWYLRDGQAEARSWIDQLQPAAASFDCQAQAELAWTATVIANEIGDDTAAMAACRRLAPLLEKIQDPFLHAIGQLATAWTSPLTGNLDGALREVSVSLEQLRGQDEPFWTALASYSAAVLETTVGRPDDAVHHLRETRDLADRFDYAWLTAMSRVQLGTLAIVQGRLDRARELLDEALDVSLAIRITRHVTLCIAALAQLAFAEGDPERAALLAGAAEGLRGRAGLRTWPILRQGEAQLADLVRRALGHELFGRAFAAGSRLSQQEAVAAARTRTGDRALRPGLPELAEETAAYTSASG
jgi:predicted ATPase